MKQYVALELVMIAFLEEDVLTNSPQGNFEGVNDLDPTTHSDWFANQGGN